MSQPTQSSIRAFLFDIGNVLVRFDFMKAWNRLAPHCACPDLPTAVREIDQIKLAYEDGKIDRASFLRAAFDALRYSGNEADFVAAYEDIFEPNEPMVQLVERLHGSFPLYLLSNTSDIHHQYVFRRYEYFRRFTDGTYSYAVKMSKPEAGIFEAACAAHGLDPKTTFFIDDLLPNIETARSLGFICHHYHLDRHGELLAQLRETGIDC